MDEELESYLSKISDQALYSYNVYQIEGEGKNLFLKIKGDKDTIMVERRNSGRENWEEVTKRKSDERI